MFRKLTMVLALLAVPAFVFAYPSDTGKPVKVITDADIGPLNYWSNDTVWNIQGFCFVESGEVLIIEGGTIIKGNEGQGAGATALLVARGGKIYAEGGPCEPIIFTSIVDLVDDPNDLDLFTVDGRGRWGGLILLGNARVNTATPNDNGIEGIPAGELRARFGGVNDDDNSGVLKYVSIRHGGSIIGAANEVNGLTMGGVGRGTKISYVEVAFNLDDGFEWFGGTVNADHLISTFNDDDAFDYDTGWRGCVQFAFCIMDTANGDRAGEHDGGTTPEDGSPFATPIFSNVTYLGRGSAATGTQRCFFIADNAGGAYFNSIFYDHAQDGLTVGSEPGQPTDCRDRLAQGQLLFSNNLWYKFKDGSTPSAICDGVAAVEAALFTSGLNLASDPGITMISRIRNNGLDPRPMELDTTSWAGWVDPINPANGFNPPPPAFDSIGGTLYDSAIQVSWNPICSVDYAGAFDPDEPNLWIHDWTAIDYYDYLKNQGTISLCDCAIDTIWSGDPKPINVVDTGLLANDTTYWGQDSVWLLSGRVFVGSGQVLIIGPGTIVKGKEGLPATEASVLIVARTGKVYMNGVECCPIIFTAENDVLADPFDLDFSVQVDVRGRWGGVILLGRAKVNTATPNDNGIEGIPPSELRARYGGPDDNDNSGVVKYVSIRHGGTLIGAANEINGLTMGGVGRATVISHVEVFYNLDDAFEWFGGSVNGDHLVSSFNDDDGFDYDNGWRGCVQFAFCVMLDSTGDRAGEHDGGTVPENGVPFATPLFSNATYIGRGAANGFQRCFFITDNAGGAYFNSIFFDHGQDGLQVENTGAQPTDARDRLLQGQLRFDNNLWYSFGDGNTPAAICDNVAEVQNVLFTSGLNFAQNPGLQINNKNRFGTGIDPRPRNLDATSWAGWDNPLNPANNYNPPPPAFDSAGNAYPAGAIDVVWSALDSVPYPGAFDPELNLDQSWVAGWTAIWCDQWLSELSPQCCFGLRGDCNNDGTDGNVLDLNYLVNRIFRGGPSAVCLDEADINGNGTPQNIQDLNYLVNRIFRGGPLPPPCAALMASADSDPINEGVITASIVNGKTVISLESERDLGAIQIDMVGNASEPAATSKISSEVELLSFSEGRNLRLGLIDLQGLELIHKGNQTLVELEGEYQIESVLAADMDSRGIIPTIRQASKETSLPTSYELAQNFPNPFNPTTEINFSLPERTQVTLEIFNVLGQRVRTLVDGNLEAGVHSVKWDSRDNDGSQVASGLYMYRIQTEKFSQSKKMILMK